MASAHNKKTATDFKNAIERTADGAPRSFAFGHLGEDRLPVLAVDKGQPGSVASTLKAMSYEGPNPPKKPRLQLVTMGAVRLEGTRLVLECRTQVSEGTLRKGFQDYFRTQFKVAIPWTDMVVETSPADEAEAAEEVEERARPPEAATDAVGGRDAEAPANAATPPEEADAPERSEQDAATETARADDGQRLADHVLRMARSLGMQDLPSAAEIAAKCADILASVPFERVLLALASTSNLTAFLGRAPLPRSAIAGEKIRKDEEGRRDVVDALAAMGERAADVQGLLADGRILDRGELGKYVDKIWTTRSEDELDAGIHGLFKTMTDAFGNQAFLERLVKAPSLDQAMAGWGEANDAVDRQIAALKRAVEADFDIPGSAWSPVDGLLRELADDGFTAARAALASADPAERSGAAARMRDAVEGKKAWLASSTLVEELDTAPFETAAPMAIRRTISAALTRIAAALRTA